MHQPIDIGTFWLFVQDRIDDLMFYFFRVVSTCQVNKMRGIFGNRSIIAQLLDFGNICFKPDKFNISVFDLPASIRYVHNKKHSRSYQKRYVTAMGTRKNLALSHRANALVAAIDLVGRQRTLTDGSFFDRRVLYPGQPASYVDSNSQGMEPCSSLFTSCDLRPLREYEQYV